VNKRIFPTLNLGQDFVIDFPMSIAVPSSVEDTPVIRSSTFFYNNQECFIRNKLDVRTKVSAEGTTPVVFETAPSNALELVSLGGVTIISNVGSYDPSTGRVSISGLQVQSIPNNRNYIKIIAIPANESVVTAELNNIIKYDPEESFTKAVKVSTR
jgi:hypothetical protein